MPSTSKTSDCELSLRGELIKMEIRCCELISRMNLFKVRLIKQKLLFISQVGSEHKETFKLANKSHSLIG